MKFSYAIGNPPYQEDLNGFKKQVWPKFIKETRKISNISCMIHPGSWVMPTKTTKKYQEDILNNNLKAFNYFPSVDECFQGVGIPGGVSITLFDKNFNATPNYYISNELKGEFDPTAIFFTNKYFEEAYNKVFHNIDPKNNMLVYLKGNIGAMGITYGVDRRTHSKFIKDSDANMTKPIKVWTSKDTESNHPEFNWYYIDECNVDLNAIPDYMFTSRKVMMTNHGNDIHGVKGNVFNNNPQILDKFAIGSGCIFFYPKNDRERELLLIKSLFMTKTARYLMSIKQRDKNCRGFECIPDYLELAKFLPEDELFTDKWFYKTFDFSEGLINEIDTRVSPKVEK